MPTRQKLDQLSGREQTTWQRIVQAVMRAWNNFARTITGRGNENLGYDTIDKLLSHLGRHVMGGSRERAMSMSQGGNYDTNGFVQLTREPPASPYITKKDRVFPVPVLGADIRGGRNITRKGFDHYFKFRDVRFGAQFSERQKQARLNETFDALFQLAAYAGVSTRALSLNGKLELVFGINNHKKSAGYYDPNTKTIQERASAYGTVSHEWFHAVDDYFAQQAGGISKGYMSARKHNEPAAGLRPEVLQAWKNLIKTVKSSPFFLRSFRADKADGTKYWSEDWELMARAYELAVKYRLGEEKEDFVSHFPTKDKWSSNEKYPNHNKSNYPWPTAEELPKIEGAFMDFFDTLKEEKTVGDNVRLWSFNDKPLASLADVTAPFKEVARKVTQASVKGAANLANAPEARPAFWP